MLSRLLRDCQPSRVKFRLFTMFGMRALVFSSLVLPVLFGLSARAASNPLLEAGINSYQKGNYDDAKANFVQLVSDPKWTFTALYNLGDIAVRQKHLGEALGYFRRAAIRKPHDSDTLFNMKFVEDALGNRRLGGKVSNFEFFRTDVLNRFSFSEFLALTLVFSFLFLFSIAGYLKSRKLIKAEDANLSAPPTPGVLLTGIFFIVIVAISGLKLYDSYTDRGTITAATVDIRSGPNESNASMQEIPEGTEVVILDDSQPDWKQVALIGGIAGWVPSKDVMPTTGGGPF